MLTSNRLSLEVKQAILGHLRARLDAKAISVSSVMKSVHKAVPRCTISDDELTDLIAETVIEAGFGVYFDGKDSH